MCQNLTDKNEGQEEERTFACGISSYQNNMAAQSDVWWAAAFYSILMTISGSWSCNIEGVLHGEVLLPCIIPNSKVFNFENLVIHWQTFTNPEILHSFYNGRNHPKHQKGRFKGRTQLFPLEFPKGNMSLLLSNLNSSDAGNYSCHVEVSDGAGGYTIHHVELTIKDDLTSTHAWYYYVPVCVLLPPAAVYLIVRIWNRN